jgi:hypothetical protein
MNRYGLMLTLLLFSATESLAQRYGRPDAAQNYGRVQNPQILLQVKVDKKSLHFRSSDPQKMQRSTVKLHDLTTNTSRTYEGVSLEVLLSKSGGLRTDSSQTGVANWLSNEPYA